MKSKSKNQRVNLKTFNSMFDCLDSLTLLQCLKKLEKHVTLESIEKISVLDGIQLKFIFSDGSYVLSPEIYAPQEEDIEHLLEVLEGKQEKGAFIETTDVQTVEGYSVPVLTLGEIANLYSALVEGRTAIVHDKTNKYSYQCVMATTNENETACITMIYDNKMILRYHYKGVAVVTTGLLIPDQKDIDDDFETVAQEINGLDDVKANKEVEDVLWENPDPSQEFAPQELSIDMRSYKKLKIVFKPYLNQSYYNVMEIDLKVYDSEIQQQTIAMGENNWSVRSVYVREGHMAIQIANAYKPNNTVDNERSIPIKIVGVKDYQPETKTEHVK